MELLRIFSIYSIVVFHCAYKSEFDFSEPSIISIAIKTLWFGGELGVNLFILITGYYQIAKRFNSQKLLKIVLEILFYWVLAVGIGLAIGIFRVENFIQLITSFFPILFGRWWYATAFVLIYILSPYLNRFAKSLTKQQFVKFLLLTLFLWCLLPTFFGMFGKGPEGLLFYTRFLWLTLMYFLGAFISKFRLKPISNMRFSVTLTVLSFIFLIASVILIAYHPSLFNRIGITEWAYFWPPNTIPMLTLSLGVFGIFYNLNPSYHPIVNRFASTVFGIYLFHDSFLANWFWVEVLHLSAYEYSSLILLMIFISAIAICFIGGLIDLIRQQLEKAMVIPFLESRIYDKFSRSLSKFINKLIMLLSD